MLFAMNMSNGLRHRQGIHVYLIQITRGIERLERNNTRCMGYTGWFIMWGPLFRQIIGIFITQWDTNILICFDTVYARLLTLHNKYGRSYEQLPSFQLQSYDDISDDTDYDKYKQTATVFWTFYSQRFRCPSALQLYNLQVAVVRLT